MNATSPDDRPATLVLDVGKTNVKVLVTTKRGEVRDVVRMDSPSKPGPPYRHLDTELIWEWLIATLADLALSHPFDAIVTTTHGCTAALVDETDLVLPILDYEADVPAEVNRAFEPLIPPFAETQTPDLPQGLNYARQLFWLQSEFAEEFSRVRQVLMYPQYWGWKLAGVAASEVTSVGCHTHLWHPGQRDFTSLVDQQGWRELFPPMRSAYEPLGPLSPDVADGAGVKTECTVFTGVHDSNANYALYLRERREPFSLVSTGTWMVMMSPRLPLARLDQARDTMALVDVEGNAVPTARYMGGRDYELLTDGAGATTTFTAADLRHIIDARSMVLPSMTPGGPFMDRNPESRTLGPEPETPAQIAARATLYVALMTTVSCRLLETDGDLIIDGGFANNTWFCRLMASLAGHERCLINLNSQGTALGAGMLTAWEEADTEWPLELQAVEPFDSPELRGYAADWEGAVEAHCSD